MKTLKAFVFGIALICFSSVANAAEIQVDIAKEDRVPNKTGIQCVWSSIETVARHNKIEELYDLTEDSRCKSFAGPSSAAKILKEKKIKFEQTVSEKDISLLIKGCKEERWGVCFGIPGHMMTMVHFDHENEKIVKYIDNSDKTLSVRTWTLNQFYSKWDGWVLMIYPTTPNMKIKDMNNTQIEYSKNYVFKPKAINNN